MISQVLQDARSYEEAAERETAGVIRPEFHLSARIGWMNDPNGFSVYNGEYHLFYQYHPYSTQWGPMHWGHAVSQDLLHWRHLPAALAPDTDYDRDGCFSGSAATLADGKHLLLYTGVVKEQQPDGSIRDVQRQCVAVGDGTDYEKYVGNPVLGEEDLPQNGSKFDFRDPKIWQQADGSFRCVVGNGTDENDGQILLYSSADAFHWKYEKILASNRGRFGRMWECPDFFALDQKYVLIMSPTDMLPKEGKYRNGNGTVCLIGSYDEESEIFAEESDQAIDYGIDFYAPQTVMALDGRRIMIGWMQNWDTCSLYMPEGQPWFGQMSLPRELSVKDGWLFQTPVRELEKLRGAAVRYQDITFDGKKTLDGIKGRKIDMELCIRPAESKDMYRRFTVYLAQNDMRYTSVSFCPYESVIQVDRTFAGARKAAVHQSSCQIKHAGRELKLRLILDQFSVEVFVNDGEYVLSTTFYTEPEADGISFAADGTVTMDVTKYDLTV